MDALTTIAILTWVLIERFRMWEYRTTWAGEFVTLRRYDVQWDDTWLSYRTKPGSNVLYTMDGDGNIKSPSVFREPWEVSGGKI